MHSTNQSDKAEPLHSENNLPAPSPFHSEDIANIFLES